jgi:peptidoglycan/LPS O-acetylase OafA/YrhL
VSNLSGGVHPGIGAARDDEANTAKWMLQQNCECLFEYPLHCAQIRLNAPARELCSVVGKIEPQSNSLHSGQVYGAQFDPSACAGNARAIVSAVAVSTPKGTRLPGLDGLRALGIVLVITYHLFPAIAPGGFIGVDVFLVVSGYLITALLIAEYRAHGRLHLRWFWGRRARRLLPALALVVGLSTAAAAVIGGDVLVGIGWQLVGVLTFSSNWVSIAQGASYLDQTSPELFRHAWSLAVEEQFYLLWPLVLALVFLIPRRSLRVVLPLALALGSAVALAVTAGDPLRDSAGASAAYLSTLTHGFGLLLGAGLALGVEPLGGRAHGTRVPGWLADAGAVLSTGGIVALALMLSIDAAVTYRGGLVAVALLTGALIMCLAHPSGRAAAIADSPLPRWIGERSYGLYLWHWPVLILLGASLPSIDRAGGQNWMLGVGALALTVPLAAASYRFIEQPIRMRRLDAVVYGDAAWSLPRRLALGAVTVLTVLGIVVAGGVAVARAPAQSEAAVLIAVGQKAIDGLRADGPLRGLKPAVPPAASEMPAPSAPVAPAVLPTGDQLIAVGDSVMLAAAPHLQERFPGIAIDAAVSRQMRQAPEILLALADTGQLRDVVIVGLGTNGPIDSATLLEVRAIIGPNRSLVIVSAQAPRGWIPEVNAQLVQFADDYRDVVIADWRSAIAPQLELLARDQVHPGSAGGRVYTGALEVALQYLADLPDPVDYDANPALPRPQ